MQYNYGVKPTERARYFWTVCLLPAGKFALIIGQPTPLGRLRHVRYTDKTRKILEEIICLKNFY
jgi:hypothetical protein